MKWLDEGVIKPIGIANVFEAGKVRDAFRTMQAGRHIGKIIISLPADPLSLESVPVKPSATFRSDRSYLLAGGLGGLGRAVANWMVENGARHLIFLSRSAKEGPHTRDFLEEVRSQGCQVQLIAGSVSRMTDVELAIRSAVVPIAGVINMSMVLKVS